MKSVMTGLGARSTSCVERLRELFSLLKGRCRRQSKSRQHLPADMKVKANFSSVKNVMAQATATNFLHVALHTALGKTDKEGGAALQKHPQRGSLISMIGGFWFSAPQSQLTRL